MGVSCFLSPLFFFGRGGGSPDFELEDDVDLMKTGGLTKNGPRNHYFSVPGVWHRGWLMEGWAGKSGNKEYKESSWIILHFEYLNLFATSLEAMPFFVVHL